ncbi:LysR family transcriptional regulator [Yinghuangia seranimata]|uniref:LysR family transcriptional regulator n=1 Tax=Yinghuangia seranimata TaxID=408067 RepID=UPI00248BFBA3|nr:LysR family transcriptional regulator [Yinghuangia seranimata]MDI2131121.1 LysR family transcriptional regulator [Yinghuangia seranimata]
MIDVEVRHLESFVAVAEEGSITRAADRLHLTQQAVSAHVKHLERALKVTLLVRTRRGVLLTPAADELLAGGRDVLTDLAALVERVRNKADERSRTLRLACCPYATALFAAVVADSLEATVPGLAVELTSVRTPRCELAHLNAGVADAAFMWLPVGDVGLHSAPVRTEGRVVALPARHRLADRAEVAFADLAGEPVVSPDIFTSPEAERAWIADPRPDGSPAPRGLTVDKVEDCLLMVARGRGVWLAPETLARWIPAVNVRWVPVVDAEPVDLAVVWTDRAPGDLIATVVDAVRTALAEAGGDGLRVA